MKLIYRICFFCLTSFCFIACSKNSETVNGDPCKIMENFKISTNSPLTIGETLTLNVPEIGGYRIYSWYGPNHFTSQYTENSITYVNLENEGWYYATVTNDECGATTDSVYIDVKLVQGSPSCTLANNTTSYSNLNDDSFTSVQKHIESTLSLLSLEGSGGLYSKLTIYFHPFWRDAEPEDGIYYTTNVPLFDQVDMNYNKVFVTTTKESIYWASAEGQKVYISHVGSKLQVRFCDLTMGGNNGNSYTTVASANIVEK